MAYGDWDDVYNQIKGQAGVPMLKSWGVDCVECLVELYDVDRHSAVLKLAPRGPVTWSDATACRLDRIFYIMDQPEDQHYTDFTIFPINTLGVKMERTKFVPSSSK
jgi:hypothetical protein